MAQNIDMAALANSTVKCSFYLQTTAPALAPANKIYDTTEKKDQATINSELRSAISDLGGAVSAVLDFKGTATDQMFLRGAHKKSEVWLWAAGKVTIENERGFSGVVENGDMFIFTADCTAEAETVSVTVLQNNIDLSAAISATSDASKKVRATLGGTIQSPTISVAVDEATYTKGGSADPSTGLVNETVLKDYVGDTKSAIVGASSDEASADTIKGAKKGIKALADTAVSSTSTSNNVKVTLGGQVNAPTVTAEVTEATYASNVLSEGGIVNAAVLKNYVAAQTSAATTWLEL